MTGLQQFTKYTAVARVDARTHSVYGIATAESPDLENEIADYTDSKKYYQQWGEETARRTREAGQEVSYGNVRWQHTTEIAGKVTRIEPKDDKRQIWIETRPLDDTIWERIQGGFVTGFSHAGKYAYRRCNVCATDIASGDFCPKCGKDVAIRYAPILTEVSYVDRPCLPEATYAYVKADGSMEVRKFFKQEEPMSPKEFHTAASKYTKSLAACDKNFAKSAEQRADFQSAKTHEEAADAHTAMARVHDQCVAQLGAEGDPTDKVSKAADAFWNNFYKPGPGIATNAGNYRNITR